MHLLVLRECVTVTFHVVIWWFVAPYILVHCLYWRQRYVRLPVDRLADRRRRWFHYPRIRRWVTRWCELTFRRTYCLHHQGSVGQQELCCTSRIGKTRLLNHPSLFTLSPRSWVRYIRPKRRCTYQSTRCYLHCYVQLPLYNCHV